jgi:hypothetical protein
VLIKKKHTELVAKREVYVVEMSRALIRIAVVVPVAVFQRDCCRLIEFPF